MSVIQTLIVLSLIYFASAMMVPEVTCPLNEVYSKNRTRCEDYCNTYGNPNCIMLNSKGGCYCKDGFIRLEADGRCVAINSYACRSKKPPTAATCAQRPNEELYEWLYDEPCPNTCANYKVPCNTMVPAVMAWGPHCRCKKGFSRLYGKCVAVEDPKCKNLWKPSVEQCIKRGNEVYGRRTTCQKTCEELITGESKTCITMEVEDCYCPVGMVRYSEGGECIPLAYCYPFIYK